MKKILIVDDEKNIRLTLRRAFANDDYQLDAAVNGEEAMRKLTESRFDLVLLDIKMPGLTGMDVLKKVREAGIGTRVIMMTAYGTVEGAVEAMKLGAVDFISKPFSPDEIRGAVKEALEKGDA